MMCSLRGNCNVSVFDYSGGKKKIRELNLLLELSNKWITQLGVLQQHRVFAKSLSLACFLQMLQYSVLFPSDQRSHQYAFSSIFSQGLLFALHDFYEANKIQCLLHCESKWQKHLIPVDFYETKATFYGNQIMDWYYIIKLPGNE